jgi:histidinol-phosphate aminotransferase
VRVVAPTATVYRRRMSVNRRELLGFSALLLAGPHRALQAAGLAPAAQAAQAQPLLLRWNENPCGPSPLARLAVSHAIAAGCRYPSDEEMQGLTNALAHKEGVGSDHIVTGTGSGELLCALGLLAARDEGEIVAAEPTYAELTAYAQGRGAQLKLVPVDGELRHDLPAMQAALSARTRAVYICNPNNPTGTALPAVAIRDFIAALPAGVTAIVDEAYMDFVTADGVGSVADLVGGGSRVVILRTFSKIHGMAGLRCGYAITRPDIADELAAARMTTPSIFAVRAARASLGDHEFLRQCRARIIASRTRILTELRRLNLRYAEPQGNFVFFDTGMPLERFTAVMLARNILVGRLFPPYQSWCRITVGTEPETKAFLSALRAVTAAA